jgi:hypothetical protein
MEPKVALSPGSAFLFLSSNSGVFSALAAWLYRACDEPFTTKEENSSALPWQDDLDARYFGWRAGEEDGEVAHRGQMLEVARTLYGYAQALTVQDKIPNQIVEGGLPYVIRVALSGFEHWVNTHKAEFSVKELPLFLDQGWGDLEGKLSYTYTSPST